jgi:hypothetical protein
MKVSLPLRCGDLENAIFRTRGFFSVLARAHAAQIFAQRQMSMSRRRAACGLTECGRLRSGFGRAERFP